MAVASPAPLAAESLVALFTAFPENADAAPGLEGSAVARFDVEVLKRPADQGRATVP